ncbi:MAG: HepT-like ribonuclease domain-containing protein, partial [Pseudomonadota bacterium]
MTHSSEALLRHILLCVERIAAYTADGQAYFFVDAKTQDAVIRNLEIIGQAVRDAGIEQLAQNDASIPWR